MYIVPVIFVFVLLLGLVAAGAYVAFFMSHVPGAVDERFGALEPLPDDLGTWKRDETSPAAVEAQASGLFREERCLFQEATFGRGGRLIFQGRLKDAKSGEIVKVEPELVVPRRRVKKKS